MHVVDCFLPVIAYQCQLLRTIAAEQPPYQEVRGQIEHLLRQSEASANCGPGASDDYHEACFAVCAWIDEGILNAGWEHRDLWLAEQLQRIYYGTSDAGDRFFQHLRDLRPDQHEVREVFYLCLALGFAGRYCNPEDTPYLEQIMAANLKLLEQGHLELRAWEREPLFPEAIPTPHAETGARRRLLPTRPTSALLLAAPLVLFLVLYLIYSFTLSGISGNFLKGGS